MIVLYLLATLSRGAFREAKVLSLPVETALLARKLGKSIVVDQELQDEMVLVCSRDDVPPKIVLESVANAVGATVSQTSSGFAIRRSPEEVQSLRAKLATERATWIRDDIAENDKFRNSKGGNVIGTSALANEILEENAQLLEFQRGKRATQNVHLPSDILPDRKLLNDLVMRIGPETLASLPVSRPVVYEDFPVAGANQLPAHQDLVDEYLTRRNRWHSVSIPEKLQVGPLGSALQQSLQRYQGKAATPSLLRLEVLPEPAYITINLLGFDEDGNLSLSATTTATAHPWEYIISNVALAAMRERTAKWVAFDVPELRDQAKAGIRGDGVKLIIDNWISHPEQDDPLNRVVSPALAELAISEDKPCVVFQIYDAVWRAVNASIQNGQLSLGALRAVMLNCLGMTRAETGESVVWRASDPTSLASWRAKRKPLGPYVLSAISTGDVSMREFAKLIANTGGVRSTVPDAWLNIARTINDDGGRFGAFPEFLYFIGTINDYDWSQLLSGKVMSIRDLGVESEFKTLMKTSVQQVTPGSDPIPDLYRHPWEMLRISDAGDCVARITEKPEQVFRILSPFNKGGPVWMPTANFGSFFTAPCLTIGPDAPKMLVSREQYETALSKNVKFMTGNRRNLTFQIELPLHAVWQVECIGNVVDKRQPMVYSEFPESVRKAVWKQCVEASLELAKRQMAEIASNKMHSANPVPEVIHP